MFAPTSIFWASLFVVLFGKFAARQTNTEDNRLHVYEQNAPHILSRGNFDSRHRYLDTNRIYKGDDYDDYSGRFFGTGASSELRYPTSPYAHAKAPIKVYRPREDPRLFYQSDDYLKEINGQNVNYEVASIYPGREVIRYSDTQTWSASPTRHLRSRDSERVGYSDFQYCVRCPRDRTVIAKAGADRVILQAPRMSLCSGLKAPKSIHFVSLHGPKFGSLLEEGTYTIMGRVMNWNENLQICKLKVHVVIQSCRTPKSLVAHCKGLNRPCNFTCRDSNLQLNGASSLTCGEDFQWNGNLPTCRVRNWCHRPSPPDHGRISCVGNTAEEASEGLVEGSRCRVRCALGWKSNPRIVSFCHRGTWTRALTCTPNNDSKIV